jgi:hypothetical protein
MKNIVDLLVGRKMLIETDMKIGQKRYSVGSIVPNG